MNYPKKPGLNLYPSQHCAYKTYNVKTWFLKTLSVYNDSSEEIKTKTLLSIYLAILYKGLRVSIMNHCIILVIYLTF